MSQDMASSQPPPRAKPFTAAITGLDRFSNRRNTPPPWTPNFLPSRAEKPFISPISAPATKDRPAPVRITAWTLSSASTLVMASSRSLSTWLFSAFNASGRLMVRMATAPCTS